ncbi:GntR family transcriptional regulator [Spirosoma sp. BT702]|uniref:GntR family transcriptional regulator n=1 Tax=Spirosoma profusum TaxID=2771354 RepID=A0A927AR13_9BACT|nr:GntR family transcriptional regulator [Spirosoma profusum]MBD2699030.1 GntR family transcriptional regulator [Spirosoma profusum]
MQEMLPILRVDTANAQPKYQQLVDAVVEAIERGVYDRGYQLPSINEVADKQGIAKVTVAKAYEELRQRGIIHAQHGKGFYVATTNVRTPLNIFVLFDTLNAYKETLYDALKASLPTDTSLSVFFHHYNQPVFESLIRNNLGSYKAYVIMPHLAEDVSEVVALIPKDKLLLIDQALPNLIGDYAAVYQDFEADTYEALTAAWERLQRFDSLTLVLAKDHFQYVPDGILRGLQRFSNERNYPCNVVDNYSDDLIQPGKAYLLFADRDLVQFIKYQLRRGWKLGQDVGLISYDDTPMKEILAGGITVISTDFAQMGRTAGELITGRVRQQVANPGGLILRESL